AVLRPVWEDATPGRPLLWRTVPDIERLRDDLDHGGAACRRVSRGGKRRILTANGKNGFSVAAALAPRTP
ncbi:MAG TPA: hypothetical protein VEL76_28945, partial [Gemmataceae bacterium]|nr:hypothetical protein [Gemmataceae bacterium]